MTDPSPAPPSAPQQGHPPKPRFALAVGVVGHKQDFWTKKDSGEDNCKGKIENKNPPPLSPEEQLKNVTVNVAAALTAIKAAALQSVNDHEDFFEPEEPKDKSKKENITPKPPILTLVSALADGADTIAAKAAYDLKYQLDVPLPFARDDYANDFTASQAKEDYTSLLGKARAVLELPGRRAAGTGRSEDDKIEVNRAYEAAGLTVLSQVDIVLAVWDRKASRGRGGTAELVAEAARAGMPIVLVDANGVLPVEVRWRGLAANAAPIVAIDDVPRAPLAQCIWRVVDELVCPPRALDQRESLRLWFAEKARKVNIRFGYSLLTTLLGARRIKRWSDWRFNTIAQLPRELAKDYAKVAAALPPPATAADIAVLSIAYGWADATAVFFAQFFRSAFVMNFLFAALAVVFASASVMIGEASEFWKRVPVGIEIFLIVCVVMNTSLGYRGRWHHRWVEAREVAERLRGALPLWTLGLRPAFFPGEEPTWTGWYARALVRMQGLRGGAIDGSRNPERDVLLDLLKGQCNYNHSAAQQMQRIESALEIAGTIFLAATVVVAFDHILYGALVHCLLGHFLPPHEATIWLSAALPALATATYGIRVIGNFHDVSHRNERTYSQLDRLIVAIKQDASDFGLLRARARAAADILLGDVASWRLAAESRGLAIPG